jgi:hypothetical protein
VSALLLAVCSGLWLWLGIPAPLLAITLFGNGDPSYHTNAPTGTLAGSGWQWEVDGGFSATVIGPHYLASARHMNLQPGLGFGYHGLPYRVIRVVSPDTGDLALLEVSGVMDNPAPLYTRTNELRKTMVLHGRGTQRGDPVYGPPPDGTTLRGWNWGSLDVPPRLRWGTNRVEDFYESKPGDAVTGSYLIAYFSSRGGADLGTITLGDSGGGAFIKDTDGRWKLAGVNFAVEAQFRTAPDAADFSAALFDRRGFYEYDDTARGWILDPTQNAEPRTAMYLTRISSYVDWIQSQFDRPSDSPWPHLEAAATVEGPYFEVQGYSVLTGDHQIQTLPPAGTQFYRVSGDIAFQLRPPVLKDGILIFGYE